MAALYICACVCVCACVHAGMHVCNPSSPSLFLQDILSITETLSMLFYQRGDHFLQENFMVAFSPLQLHCVRQRRVLPIGKWLLSCVCYRNGGKLPAITIHFVFFVAHGFEAFVCSYPKQILFCDIIAKWLTIC